MHCPNKKGVNLSWHEIKKIVHNCKTFRTWNVVQVCCNRTYAFTRLNNILVCVIFFFVSKIPNRKRQHEVCKIFKYSNLDSITSLRFEPLECCELQDRGNHLGQFYWHDPKGKNWWKQNQFAFWQKGTDEQTWKRFKQIAIVGFWKPILKVIFVVCNVWF